MSALSKLLWKTLDSLGLSGKAANFRNRLQSAGLAPWKPLVPPDAFTQCCLTAIKALEERNQLFADYVEFGVSRGTSMACASRALRQTDHGDVRLVGFDSFEGMPPGSEAEGWQTGEFRSTLQQTRAYLEEEGVDLGQVELVKGWFSDTCNSATRQRLALHSATLIMFDCDIYSATVEALDFAGPLLTEHSVAIFDDWGWMADKGQKGQKEAFEQFLERNPCYAVTPLPAYRPEARVFLLSRSV
jgi:hypothetical protein